MKKLLLLLTILSVVSLTTTVSAQVEKQNNEENPVCGLPVLSSLPEFPGGHQNLERYIKNRLHYPKKAKRKNTNGEVVVSFVIQKDGSIGNINILKSLSDGCDDAVIHLIKKIPKWIPAFEDGRPIEFLYHLSFQFEKGKINLINEKTNHTNQLCNDADFLRQQAKK